VLRRISELKAAFGLPVLVSVSRKSFLRPFGRKPVDAGAATLAAELFAASRGADYIRTHDPGALRDAFGVFAALTGKPVTGPSL
jgi:dihydropteroate synthase type 2